MKQEVRVWWEELADQYEEWAEKPPTTKTGRPEEVYTCHALREGWGLESCSLPKVCDVMSRIWRSGYGNTHAPAGLLWCDDRDSLRFDFCWYMAERIREYLGEE